MPSDFGQEGLKERKQEVCTMGITINAQTVNIGTGANPGQAPVCAPKPQTTNPQTTTPATE